MTDRFSVGVGKQPLTSSIGFCSQCRNKAEISVYPGDNPDPICGDCYQENLKLEQAIADQGKQPQPTQNGAAQPAPVAQLPERERYIKTICEKADDAWVGQFIEEVIVKNVLRYDWQTIIQNERWFSVLDLRRFALGLDPDVDKPKVKEKKINPGILAMRKKRLKQKGKGAKHATTS